MKSSISGLQLCDECGCLHAETNVYCAYCGSPAKKLRERIKIFFLVALALVSLFFVLVEFDRDWMQGYAGESQQYDDGVVLTSLFFNEEDIVNVHHGFVATPGTHIQQNDWEWTSSGHVPQKGDYIRVSEFRISWRFGYGLIHGWGYTEIVPVPGMSLIGKTIHGTPEFYTMMAGRGESEWFADDDPTVVDATNEVVRVRTSVGNEYVFGWGWFQVDESELPIYYEWLVGNKFTVGQVICSTVDSPDELPDRVKVLAIDGQLLKVSGYDGSVSFGHFQECR